jgi:hypothetical protein
MSRVALVVATLALGLSTSIVVAEDVLETAKKYVEFWKPVEGAWEITSEDRPDAVIWHHDLSPTGLCYTGGLEVNGQKVRQSIHGYDPEHKCWRSVAYMNPSEEEKTVVSTRWLVVDVEASDHVAAGTTFIGEGRDVLQDGTVKEGRGRWTFLLVEKDKMELGVTEITIDGEAQPDFRLKFKRVAK